MEEGVVTVFCPNNYDADHRIEVELQLHKEFQMDVRFINTDTVYPQVIFSGEYNTDENITKAIDIIKRIKKWYG